MQFICVYCSSSSAVAPEYFQAAEELGEVMARAGKTLVYGGGCIGLMGAVARSVHQHGGKVIGVIPEYLRLKEVCYEDSDELIITETMRERKAIMEARADAFLALPGGFGTLEEIMEILTLKQLQRHAKPIIFLNTCGFYDPLLAQFQKLYDEQFTKAEFAAFYHVAQTPAGILPYLQDYQPAPIPKKWY